MLLCCAQHDEDYEAHLLFCQSCLVEYLSQHDNTCPLTQHKPCQFESAQYLRRQILNASVMCPNGVESKDKDDMMEGRREEFGRDIEGTRHRKPRQAENTCHWKGKLKVKRDRVTCFFHSVGLLFLRSVPCLIYTYN